MKRRQKTEEQGRVVNGSETSLIKAKKARYITFEGKEIQEQPKKMVDRPAIISETPIESDKLEAMEKIVNDGDFRMMFGIKDSTAIEVQWSDGGKWTPAVVNKAENGRTHRFHDKDLADDESEPEYENDDELDHDFLDVPIVTIFKDGEKEERDICFINRCLIYDIKEGEIFNWKHFGDPWVGDVKDGSGGLIEEFAFTNETELRENIESFVPRMMCNVLEKNREFFDQLPPEVQASMTQQVLQIKNSMVDKIVDFFIKKESLVPGTQVVLDPESMQNMCDQVLVEMYENNK